MSTKTRDELLADVLKLERRYRKRGRQLKNWSAKLQAARDTASVRIAQKYVSRLEGDLRRLNDELYDANRELRRLPAPERGVGLTVNPGIETCIEA